MLKRIANFKEKKTLELFKKAKDNYNKIQQQRVATMNNEDKQNELTCNIIRSLTKKQLQKIAKQGYDISNLEWANYKHITKNKKILEKIAELRRTSIKLVA